MNRYEFKKIKKELSMWKLFFFVDIIPSSGGAVIWQIEMSATLRKVP